MQGQGHRDRVTGTVPLAQTSVFWIFTKIIFIAIFKPDIFCLYLYCIGLKGEA